MKKILLILLAVTFSTSAFADSKMDLGLEVYNNKDYSGFTRDFSAQMLYGANEIELGKQWANNKLLTSLSQQREFLGCLRRNNFVTVLFKQMSDTVPGDFLGRLVLGVEGDKVKVFGATIF